MKLFSFLYGGELHPSSNDKIIPAEAYSQLLDLEAMKQKMLEEMESYRRETEEECEKLRKKAKEKGFKEGLESLNAHIIHVDAELKRLRHEMQQLVLPIALKAAEKIVNKQLTLHPETIVDIVMQALASVAQHRKIIIYVSKQDKAALEANKPKIREILEHVESLTILEKSDLTPGGCIIQTEAGMINSSLENQWKALERAFEKYTRSQES
jgi:type III secretion protein L